ncbi:MAG: sigma-70 family RNA polymerase sigma factor [Candidatus Omnitrophica bacterium]|nr:sigma-70 family RNA polymerase sigma factor [Candidatus Omnitrophota bacterium]
MESELHPSDNELIEQAKGGDHHAFSVLYERYRTRILNYVGRFLGERALAEEVTQNTFVAVFRNLHRYRPGKSAKPWIYQIASNLARNAHKTRKRAPQHISIDEPVREGEEGTLGDILKVKEATPSEALRAKEFHEEVQRAIDELPEKYREVLLLHDVEGTSYEEIQKILGLPRATVAKRLSRARLYFRRHINPSRIDVELFLFFHFSEVTMKLGDVFEKWRLSDETIASFVDGELPEGRTRVVERLISRNTTLTAIVREMEQAKIILHEVPAFEPTPAFDARVMAAIEAEAQPEAAWLLQPLKIFDAVFEHLAVLPRGVLALMIASVLGVSTMSYVAQVENARSIRVEQAQGTPLQEGAVLARGQKIQIGKLVKTDAAEMLTIRRKDLFILEVKEKTSLTVERISKVGGLGENDISLHGGTLFFKSEPKLSHGDFLVKTPWFKITNAGTIASFALGPIDLKVAVLSGRIKLEPLPELKAEFPEPIFVNEGEEFIFDHETMSATHKTIGEETIKPLSQFSEKEVVLLGLPPKDKAKTLVGKKQQFIFAVYNVDSEEDQKMIDEALRIFSAGAEDKTALNRASAILLEVGKRYGKLGRFDTEAKLMLASAAILDHVGNYGIALEQLREVLENKAVDSQLRALASVAQGIIYEERLKDPTQAGEAYQKALEFKPETVISDESRDRLANL